MTSIVCKELADHFGGWRFIILGLLMAVTGISSVYVGAQTIRSSVASGTSPFVFLQLFTTSGSSLPPFISFVGFLGPLFGLALGFDAIGGERERRTLSRLLAQPIHRDEIINGKFVAGLTLIGLLLLALVLFVSGVGLHLIGVPPQPEEVARLGLYIVVSIVYIGFWLSLGTLFSVIFRQVATSALAGIAAWLFFTIFLSLLAGLVAGALAPATSNSPVSAQLAHIHLLQGLSDLSPNTLYSQATAALLTPGLRSLGPLLMSQTQRMVAGQLSLGQSLLLVWPEMVGLVAGTAICFGLSYTLFMRQEIRTL